MRCLIRKSERVDLLEVIKSKKVQRRPRGNPAGNKSRYVNTISAFDIECSTIKEYNEAFCYLWNLSIDNEIVLIGRTIREFVEKLKTVVKYLQENGLTWVIYVHNLAYEIQFLMGVYNFTNDDLFIIKSRKVIKATMFNCIELRCSYALSNLSLFHFCKARKAKHLKLSGEDFNYSIFRTPKSKLKLSEYRYALYDVMGLVDALNTEFSIENDNLYTIPLTATGYIRRDIKRALKNNGREEMKASIPPVDVFVLAREAFAGGNTHANRFYSGKVLKGELAVRSKDESSAYPFVICTKKFPKGEWTKIENPTKNNYLRKKKQKRAILARLIFKNIRIKENCPNSCISVSKCIKITKDGKGLDEDNGRVLRADFLEIAVTDIDFDVISECYIFDDFSVDEMFFSGYGRQPAAIVKIITELFKKKTELKGLDGWEEVLYAKSKEKINSCYGLEAQNPLKDEVQFIDGEYVVKAASIEDYDKKAKKGLPYTWGVWVTAYARAALHEGLKQAGENAIYWDTDSIKYIKECDTTKIDQKRKEESIKAGLFATDKKGIVHYGGIFEEENGGEPYEEFKTLGAKKYVYRDKKGLNCTISGVVKKKGGAELEKHGGVDAFREGFTFYDAGGTDIIYNDVPSISTYYHNGEEIEITRNAVIKNSTYTVGLTQEYVDLINSLIEKGKI